MSTKPKIEIDLAKVVLILVLMADGLWAAEKGKNLGELLS